METQDITVMSDTAYQGFDGGTFGVPESYGPFWCRRVTVRRESDGRIACGIGPRDKALEGAIRNLDTCEAFVYHGGVNGFAQHDPCDRGTRGCPCACHTQVPS